MALSKIDKPKRGRTTVTTQVPADMIDALDAWIADQPDPKPSRRDAIRTGLGEWLTYYRLDKNRSHSVPRRQGRPRRTLVS